MYEVKLKTHIDSAIGINLLALQENTNEAVLEKDKFNLH